MAAATSTLLTIQNKIRRITRSMSVSQLSEDEINQYINTFIAYDFPEHLRMFNLNSTFTFYTKPYVAEYDTNTTDVTDPLYDFKNKYLTIQPPIYIAGYQAAFYESRQQFFAMYPLTNSIASIGTAGNGAAVRFTGVINSAQANIPPFLNQNTLILANNVLFSSVDVNNNALAMTDYPISSSMGNLRIPNQDPTSTVVQDPNNYINYLTGQFVVTFATAPQTGAAINSQTIVQQPTLPQSLLFYDGKFTVRPVPDQPYTIQMEVYRQPTQLLLTTDNPDLREWWQYIAYGAAKKVFEDRMDLDSVAQIMPEFKKQESLILRRTIVQQTSQRVSTIYSDGNAAGSYGPGLFSGGGQF